MMWNRFPYISLIDEDAQVNLKSGMRIDILAGQISRILLAF